MSTAGRHGVPLARYPSVGHACDDPSQTSARSQVIPVAGLHTVPAGDGTSAGQAADDPVHVSTGSQPPPVLVPHAIVAGWNRSVGQNRFVGTQTSAVSQTPADARQVIAAGESPVEASADPTELAALTGVCATLLNLDEVLTKE